MHPTKVKVSHAKQKEKQYVKKEINKLLIRLNISKFVKQLNSVAKWKLQLF